MKEYFEYGGYHFIGYRNFNAKAMNEIDKVLHELSE